MGREGVSGGGNTHPGETRTGPLRNALPPGTRLNEFELERVLGEGGFGVVYLAFDHSLERHVALKEYLPGAFACRHDAFTIGPRSEQHRDIYASGLRSFIQEARLLAQFEHPALVKVLRFWEGNGTAYMAMGYYQGTTLRELLKTTPGYASETALMTLLGPLLDAVELLHARQCFHRDIAPDNIIVQPNGGPVLLDFGAARRIIGDLTQALTVVLKPGYAPVEQYAEEGGLKQGPWTDVYGFAAVLYAAVTGRPPPMAIGRAFNDGLVPLQQVAPAGYSQRFLRAIDAGLAVRPEHRPQSIAAFREMLGLPRPAEDPRTQTLPRPLATIAAAASPSLPTARQPRTGPEVDSEATVRVGKSSAPRVNNADAPWKRKPVQMGTLAVGLLLLVGAAVGLFHLTDRDGDAKVASRPSVVATAAPATATLPASGASIRQDAGTTSLPPVATSPPPASVKPAVEAARPAASEPSEPAVAKPSSRPAAPSAPPPPAIVASAAPKPLPPPVATPRAAPAPAAPTDARAQFELGQDYELGRGVVKNEAEAAQWYRRAADQGFALAQAALAGAYRNGRGVPRTPTEAEKWTRRAAEQGLEAEQLRLGDMYLDHKGQAQNFAEAARWYRRAAEQGSVKAQLHLGHLYRDGLGVTKDVAEALRWYGRAAGRGDEVAQTWIARLTPGLAATPASIPTPAAPPVSAPAKTSLAKAEQREQPTATASAPTTASAVAITDPAAMQKIGRDYELGRGVTKDVVEAAKWYRRSAELGNALGMNGLGVAYEHGWGMPKDDAEATKWYRKGAELGNPSAENNLGNTYWDGRGVLRNEVTAATWYRKAAEHGHAGAQSRLGFMYENGRGVFQNVAEAVKWYRQSAEQGYQWAQYNLGRMYESGNGVNKDSAAAANWFRKAAEQGHALAGARLAALSGNATTASGKSK